MQSGASTLMRLTPLSLIKIIFLLIIVAANGCSDPRLVGQAKGSKPASGDDAKTTAPEPGRKTDAPKPTLGGADYPEAINGSYLTCGWSEVSDSEGHVTILAQWHKKDGTLMGRDRVTQAKASWSLKRTDGSTQSGVTFITPSSDAEQLIKLDLAAIRDSVLELAYLGPDLESIQTQLTELSKSLPQAQLGSSLMSCLATDSLSSCFKKLNIKSYQKGEIQPSTMTVPVVVSPPLGSKPNPMVNPTTSYLKNIAPIMSTHCLACHDIGDKSPTLASYDEVKATSDLILQSILTQRMPPNGLFPLVSSEISELTTWINEGFPR
jgi:hypothetical protein